jgi:hypothetical protein
MAKPSDREYALHRKIRDLEEQNRKKDLEIDHLKKKVEKLENKDTQYKPVKGKKVERGCPTCGSAIKATKLPFGTLRICSDGCGWREVEHD